MIKVPSLHFSHGEETAQAILLARADISPYLTISVPLQGMVGDKEVWRRLPDQKPRILCLADEAEVTKNRSSNSPHLKLCMASDNKDKMHL